MLSIEEFEPIIYNFTSYYGKDLTENPFALSVWYEHLTQSLQSDELIPALRQALAVCEFCPSPQKVIELFTGGDEAIAIDEWNKILTALNRNQLGELQLSPQGEKAFTSIGGSKRLEQAESETTHGFIRKDFVNYWLKFKRAIASGKITPPPLPLNSAQEPTPNLQDDGWVPPEELTAFWSKINGSIKTIK